MADKGFDPKQWPNVNMAFQNVLPKPQSVLGDIVRFIGYGFVILVILRVINWIAY